MNVTMQELMMLLGEKDVIIFQLTKEINQLQAELSKLQKLPEDYVVSAFKKVDK